MDSDYIVGVHDLIVHNYGAGRSLASLHAEVPSDSDFVAVHEVIDEAEKRVWQQTGVYVVIHMDPIDVNNAHVAALREQADAVLRSIDERLSMHDFRVVDGERQINLIFDVVVPHRCRLRDEELCERLSGAVRALDERYFAVIQVDRSGQNCILLYGGSNRRLTEAQISETIARFFPGDWLILQKETNLLPELVDAGFAKGMRVVLNPSPYNESIAQVDLSKVSWLLVNEVEAKQCSGTDEPEKVWAYLHERYPSLSLLVTLGGDGSAAFTGTERVRQAAFPVKAVDTTAAGDTFTGYFIAGLMEKRPLAECLRRASMAAAVSVTRPGAAPSIPEKEEVERLL